MSSVAVAYFYHFLVHVAIVQLIAIKIFNRSAALVYQRNTAKFLTQCSLLSRQ